MMSTRLIFGLIIAYAVIAGVAAIEHKWPRVLYFVSAMGISVAVLWMTEDR